MGDIDKYPADELPDDQEDYDDPLDKHPVFWLIVILPAVAVILAFWPKDSQSATDKPLSCLPSVSKGEIAFGFSRYPTANVFTHLHFYQTDTKTAAGFRINWCIRTGSRLLGSGTFQSSPNKQLDYYVDFSAKQYKALRKSMKLAKRITFERRFVTTMKFLPAMKQVAPFLHVEVEDDPGSPPK